MTWHALYYPLLAGSERTVGDLFRASGRPRFDVTDADGVTVGRLLGTMAFVGQGKAIRVMEVDGALPKVAAHMSRQPEVRDFETKLEDHLAVPRDMRSPAGARAFFRDAAMDSVQVAVTEQGPVSSWTGLFHPVVAGHEPAVRELSSDHGRPDPVPHDAAGDEAGRVLAMLSFVGREKAVRLVKVDGPVSDLDEDLSHRPAAREFEERLGEHVAGVPAATAAGHFGRARLDCVLSRRHDQDV